jgi:hypothetical protein
MLSASNTFAAFGRFGSRDFDRRGFNARLLEQLLREPRRIEILGQNEHSPFSVRRRLELIASSLFFRKNRPLIAMPIPVCEVSWAVFGLEQELQRMQKQPASQ